MLTSFKGASDSPNQVVFPTAVLYIKDANASAAAAGSGGGSSGLSGGAIAGIAVGAVAGAALLAACAWLLLQRQRRRGQPAVVGLEEGPYTNDHLKSKLETGGSWGSDGALHAAGSAPRNSLGSAGSKRNSVGGGSADAIPELVQYVAAQEASLLTNGTISPQRSLQAPWEDSMLLPPHLRPCMVDASLLTYLRRPDGSLWQIGSGASSKVYRVEYKGEELAAKEVELGGSEALRETFVTEARMLHQVSRWCCCGHAEPAAALHMPSLLYTRVLWPGCHARAVAAAGSVQPQFRVARLRPGASPCGPRRPACLTQLRHPNVVGFAGVTFRGTKGVVLMELCEGAPWLAQPRVEAHMRGQPALLRLGLGQLALPTQHHAASVLFICHCPSAGRDLHSVLQLTAAGSQERLFGWHRRGKRVALDIAKVGALGPPLATMPIRVTASFAPPCMACAILLLM